MPRCFDSVFVLLIVSYRSSLPPRKRCNASSPGRRSLESRTSNRWAVSSLLALRSIASPRKCPYCSPTIHSRVRQRHIWGRLYNDSPIGVRCRHTETRVRIYLHYFPIGGRMVP